MATVAHHHHHHHHHHHFNMFSFFAPKQDTTVQVPELQAQGAKMTALSDERVDVIVGHNGKARTWKLHKDLLSQNSTYFLSAFQNTTEEATSGEFTLADENPQVFELWVDWLYSNEKEIQIGGSESELDSTDPWVHHAEAAYELGQLLQSPRFCRFAFVKYTQGIRFAPADVVMQVFHDGHGDALKEDCPLRRFTCAWLWYLRHTHACLWIENSWWISDGDLADPVCGPLVKKMKKDATFGGVSGLLDKACDPHWLNIEHWYSECSSNPRPHNCSHVPYPCNMDAWGVKKD